MSVQTSWLHETWHDAITADIQVLGGKKRLCVLLWPGESEQTAYNRMKACCTEGHAQQFKPLEVLKIKQLAHDVSSHALVEYESRALNYRVEWLSPDDEKARLQQEFVSAVERLEQIRRSLSVNESRVSPLAGVRR